MNNARGALLAVLTALGAAMTLATVADAADAILSGAITSAAGKSWAASPSPPSPRAGP